MDCSSDSATSSSAESKVSPAKSLYRGPDVDSTFSRSISQWRSALFRAKSNDTLYSNLDLRRCLLHVPELPKIIPSSRWVEGHSAWSNSDPLCSLQTRRGRGKRVFLTKLHPTICAVSASASFRIWDTMINNGIALLVLGWAYVLSAELAERQGLSMEYSSLHETFAAAALDLDYASPKELRWWKAIVTQGVGWSVVGGRVAPWAVSAHDLGIQVSGVATGNQRPPTAREAACYLSRLCQAYDLGNQASAAIAAAITIPLHAHTAPVKSVRIELPRPSLTARVGCPHSADAPTEFNSIGYYMVLSLCPWAIGSSLWSVFWNPDVPCNAVGAWVLPIADLLEPIINNGDMELLAKVLSTNAVSPLWLGVALCGRGTIINCILPSLTKLHDYPFFRPDPDAVAWTGAAQSFLDGPQTPLKTDGTISRAVVWRLRHECYENYSDDAFSHPPPFGWAPFGRMQATDVELEIREHLSCSHEWRYTHWTWSLGRIDRGFNMNGSYTPQPLTLSDHQPLTERWTASSVRHAKTSESESEAVINASEIATKAIFWWSCGQVERGFGGTIVPHRFRPDERLKRVEGPRHKDSKLITEWLQSIEA